MEGKNIVNIIYTIVYTIYTIFSTWSDDVGGSQGKWYVTWWNNIYTVFTPYTLLFTSFTHRFLQSLII